MNTSLNLSEPKVPVVGDTFYDINVGTMKVFIGGDWHPINNIHNNKRFFWLEDTKLPYVKILNEDWFINHYGEITEWLAETKSGEYLPALSAIAFNSEESATFFRLKWG